MNKQELITAMSTKSELSKKDVEKVLSAFIETVTEELVKGEKVALTGFGSFEVAERAERTGRNPQTSETMTIPASKAPKLKFSKNVKELLNN